MGFFDWVGGFLGVTSRAQVLAPSSVQGVRSPMPPIPVIEATPVWVMPAFRDRDICDWEDEIARFKREQRLDEALALARGCMEAMVQTAVNNPANAMEHYVIQVAVIQRKMKAYRDETLTIETWLATGIPAQREDHRLELRKRMAKAQELLARQEGRDSTVHYQEWKRLVELEKDLKTADSEDPAPVRSASVTGRSATRAGTGYGSRPRSSWLIPGHADLLSPVFVAVDFETANRRGGVAACQIALVKVVDGVVVDRFSTLLKPPSGWDVFEFTYLHGISHRDTRKAPAWGQVAQQVAAFVAGVPVYAHNATFDARVWRELDKYFGTTSVPDNVYCTYRLAERALPGLDNYKLPTVSRHCAPSFRLEHHRADSDAEACALIVSTIQSKPELLSRIH